MNEQPAQSPSSEHGQGTAEPRILLLTNRFNLLGILGARLIQPAVAYRKYYEDLLAMVPGRIPLLDHAPSSDLVDRVTGGARGAFPVLLELGCLDGLSAITISGGWLVDGSIPFSRVTAIHFPDQKSLREHQARPYANLHPHEGLLRVAEAFASAGSAEKDRAFLEALRDERPEPPTRDWNRIDRLRGALGAAVAGASTGRTLDIAATLLASDEVSPSAAPWLMPEELQSLAGPVGSPKKQSAEQLLFTAVLENLVSTDVTEAWSPRETISAVRDTLIKTSTTKANARTLERNLDLAAAIVAGQREFSPFKTTAQGLTTAKAFLLVLLREDLKRLLEWPVEETGADDLTRQTAAIFAGALRGLSREDTSIRNVRIDDLTADLVSEGARTSSDRAIERFADDDHAEILCVAGEVVAKADAPARTAGDILNEIPKEALTQIRLALCERLEWHDLVTTTVVFKGPVSLNQARSGLVTSGNAVDISQSVDPDAFARRVEEQPPDVSLVEEVVARG